MTGIDDIMLGLIQDPDRLKAYLAENLLTCARNAAGFDRIVQQVELDPDSEVKRDRALKALLKSARHQNEVLARVLFVLAVYVGSDSFGTDVGRNLVNSGRGEDALRAMLARKMG